METFFSVLFTVLARNIATLIGIVLAGCGLYFIASPNGRLIIKSAYNWMFATSATNPKLAAGAFDEKIKELRSTLRKAEDLNQKALGELAELRDKYENAQREYEKYSKQAIVLERRGEHEQAIILARKASQAQALAKNYFEQIPKFEAIAEATTKRVNEVQWLIAEAEQRKEIVVSNMEKGQFEKKVAEELKGLNVSPIDAYLKQIEDSAEDKKYQAIGARMSYETSDVKRAKDAEEAATMIDAEAFLQGLLEENNE